MLKDAKINIKGLFMTANLRSSIKEHFDKKFRKKSPSLYRLTKIHPTFPTI